MIVKANMINGLKSYSGKIRFEENDFEFIKDAANVNLLTGKICYKDIKSVDFCNVMGFFPTGIVINFLDGTNKVFAVMNRKRIRAYIIDKINAK